MLLCCCTQNFSTNIEEGCRQFWRVLLIFLTFALHRLSDDTGIYFSESLNAKMRLAFVSTTYENATGKITRPHSVLGHVNQPIILFLSPAKVLSFPLSVPCPCLKTQSHSFCMVYPQSL